MNTKRQTVWLVSMLSLMVVLSAYYLFTEDSGSKDMLTEANPIEANGDSEANGLVITEVEQQGNAALSQEDLEVIKKFEEDLAAISGSADYFTQQQMARYDQISKTLDDLYMLISNTSSQAPEEASATLDQIHLLEEKYQKMTSIEEELQEEFRNVIVEEGQDSFKVVVQSDKLERSQADSIITMVMNTLEVPADRVSVQFIP